MDDPWGSPWASAPADTPSKNDHSPSPSPPKSLLSLPPKAFFGGSPNLPAHSPWADHGFGDWASPGPADDNNVQWASWAEPGLAPRGAESPGKQSPIAWPSSTATSPGLKPMRSRSSTYFRQSSPDPWANEAPWRDRDEAPPPNGNATPSTALDHNATTPVDADVVIQVEAPRPSAAKASDSRGDAQSQVPREGGTALACSSTLAAEAEGRESPSRPSSTFSVESPPGLERQDSPITSIDEELSFVPRNLTRKASSKVSDLVGLYDGLARAASDGSQSRPVSRKTALDSSQIADQDGTAGLCELESDLGQDLSDSKDPRTSMSSDRSSTPKVQNPNRLSHGSHESSNENHDPIDDAHVLALQQLTEKFGVIKFEPDVKWLDKAFQSKLQPDYEECSNPERLPDHIITDTFGTVDERKAWYRVSRFGSMRKHDSGDDENYHRVTWQTSQLHDDAIKIVRRWMEEDSISGKPILGGGKRTSAFNWDSAAAPVALDKVFARRSLGARPRGSSTAPMGHTPASSIGSLNSVMEEPRLMPLPGGSLAPSSAGTPPTSASPIASFGWGTRPPVASIMTARSSLRSLDIERPVQKPVSPISPVPPSPALPQSQSISASAATPGDDDDNDDDWGEMVFSPTQETFTALENDPMSQSTLDVSSRLSISGSVAGRPMREDQVDIQPRKAVEAVAEAEASASALQVHCRGRSVQLVASPDEDPWASNAGALEAPTGVTQSPATAPSSHRFSAEPSSSISLPRDRATGPFSSATSRVSSSIAECSTTMVDRSPAESSLDDSDALITQQILQGLPDLTYMLRQ